MDLAPLTTARLRLEPVTAEMARAILAGGAIIGDCGLAAPSRGQGYGSEVVAAITEWLLAQPEVRQVRACTLSGNVPSRRVLEKAGFACTGTADGEAVYERCRM
jgi:RimJ/RimL family protein N-acetyltransferase